MSKVKNYFETHAHNHAYHWDPQIYDEIFKFLKNSNQSDKETILDLGCGDGSFLKGALMSGIQGWCLGTDVSYSMIKTAKENLRNFNVDLIVCDGFTLPMKVESQFDLIHIDSVLHHLIGKTRRTNMRLVTKMLRLLNKKLSKNGILIIEEVYYDSYVFQSITTAIIFYALKLLNFIHLDSSKMIKEIQLGLEVNFMPTGQIRVLLENLGGNTELLKKDPWRFPIFYRILLLKERGHITYLHRQC